MEWLTPDIFLQSWSFGMIGLVLYYFLTKFSKQLDSIQASLMSCKEALDSQKALTDKLIDKLFRGNI